MIEKTKQKTLLCFFQFDCILVSANSVINKLDPTHKGCQSARTYMYIDT